MALDLPTRARAVIVGGLIGCSVAYHRDQDGWTDIVRSERKQSPADHLACGGLIGQLPRAIT